MELTIPCKKGSSLGTQYNVFPLRGRVFLPTFVLKVRSTVLGTILQASKNWTRLLAEGRGEEGGEGRRREEEGGWRMQNAFRQSLSDYRTPLKLVALELDLFSSNVLYSQ